jgi:hypothetical protein
MKTARAIYDPDRVTVCEQSRWFQTVRVISADSPISVSKRRVLWGAVAADVGAGFGVLAFLAYAATLWL